MAGVSGSEIGSRSSEDPLPEAVDRVELLRHDTGITLLNMAHLLSIHRSYGGPHVKKISSIAVVLSLVFAVAALYAGDASACKKEGQAQASTKSASCAKSCSKSASAAALAAIPYDAGKEVKLQGGLVCGHCDMHATEGCQAVFQTADGKAYLLIESDTVEKMRGVEAKDGFAIVTRVREVDGTKFLEVEEYKAL